MISENERAALESMGGTFVEAVQGEFATFSFESVTKMMVLIDMFKADKKLSRRMSVNSKKVDGVNLVTFSCN